VGLGSAKLFGGERRLLRFAAPGICFALNIPRDSASPAFMAFMDGLIVELGGIPNIAKDSRLPGAVVRATYRGFDEFRSGVHGHDPRRLFQSELSQRLGI